MPSLINIGLRAAAAAALLGLLGGTAIAQDSYSSGRSYDSGSYGANPGPDDAYRPPSNSGGAYRDDERGSGSYRQDGGGGDYEGDDGDGYGRGSAYNSGPPPPPPSGGYGQPYAPPRSANTYPDERYYDERPRGGGDYYADEQDSRTYSQNEILRAGHGFFGSVSKGLASVVEYAFQKSGRPNGYILGEDAGAAIVAGLRYGEGRLFTKDAGTHKVYWQGPSVGYDFGAEGSKTMVLVYNMRDPSDIYRRFGGVEGSAYVVGGVGIQFQKYGDVVLAPIRSGIGLRLGANVGYLKYTRSPTWNPF